MRGCFLGGGAGALVFSGLLMLFLVPTLLIPLVHFVTFPLLIVTALFFIASLVVMVAGAVMPRR